MRTAYLTMVKGYPGGTIHKVSGYSDMRIDGKFVIFIIDGDNKKHLYFKIKNILEIVTVKGKM